MFAETPYLLWYTTHSYMTTKTTPRSLSQHEACAHTHGYTTTMLQDHKHSASHDHRKWNTTILKHDRATKPQSLEHIHDRRLGKIKYTKVSLYTYLLGVKEKLQANYVYALIGSVRDKPSILYIICCPCAYVVRCFSLCLSLQCHSLRTKE